MIENLYKILNIQIYQIIATLPECKYIGNFWEPGTMLADSHKILLPLEDENSQLARFARKFCLEPPNPHNSPIKKYA